MLVSRVTPSESALPGTGHPPSSKCLLYPLFQGGGEIQPTFPKGVTRTTAGWLASISHSRQMGWASGYAIYTLFLAEAALKDFFAGPPVF